MSTPYAVLSTSQVYRGPVIALRTDVLRMPDGSTAARDIVSHPGAVAVVALDDRGWVLLVRQYRHAVGARLWELPAGLRDTAGEADVDTARRELLEETGFRAEEWEPLLEVLTSPGFCDEQARVYLARGLSAVPAGERPALHDEEADIELAWVDLDAGCQQVLRGEIRNALCVMGLLAAQHRLARA